MTRGYGTGDEYGTPRNPSQYDDRTREMPAEHYGDDRYDQQYGRQQFSGGRAAPPGTRAPVVNAGRLWAGGVATAIVAALIALVGVLIARALPKVEFLGPLASGPLGSGQTVVLCLSAAVAALAATGLAHLLLVSTPRPLAYFGWIVALVTVVVILLAFLGGGDLGVKIASGVIYLVIGIAIGSLVTGAAISATGGRAASR
ncbi:hypothetical protein PSU4_18150 [Pseudonocardia sulfidoxydans NBRC 16205]|uniref:Uncharacterized protein n=1 Tax=Pseudonocardia sulfidoxydans NBRC 16205 TaxID=1223511 RepID=A0A511DDI8_9PSEU|nr:DUF6069 family protein [Pseudonocardia sulfidoxydans]GEL22861.1 hypothetical protein PSU4_18150 [Pseudonocardia sulfidoxydans NBRC 16205]